MNTNQSVCKPQRHQLNRRTRNQFYHHIPRINILKSDPGYSVEMAIPGIDKDNIDIQMNGRKLIVSHKEGEERNVKYLSKGFDLSGFKRTIELPKDINVEQISASFDAGVLTIALPVKEEARPRQISIQ